MIKEKYIENIKETSINIVQSNFESLRKKNITKTGLRVYDQGKLGIAGALGDYDEKELESKAKDNLILPYEFQVSKNLKLAEDHSKEILSDEKLCEEVEDILEVCRKDYKDFGVYNKIKIINESMSLSNNEGLELLSKDSYLSCELMFSDKAIAGLEGFFWGFESRNYSRENIIKEIDSICGAYRNKLTMPEKKTMPVIFIDYEMLPLLKFYTDLNGVKFGSGTYIFSKELNNRKFNEDFTLYATRNPEDVKTPFFDAEGVVNDNYRYALIENGVIKSPYTDKRTANMFNLPLTGSAASAYDSAPNLAAPQLKIKEGKNTLKELLGGEKAILVVNAAGGDFTQEGNFATPVQVPILFDGENMLGMLPKLQVSSNIYDMFGQGFRGVSTDFISPSGQYKALVMDMMVETI